MMKPIPVPATRFWHRTGRMIGLVLVALMMTGASPAQAQIDKLPHPDTTRGNFFGVAVAIDGDRALVGASSEDTCGMNAGAAYLFERDPATDLWYEAGKLTPDHCIPGEFFGRSVALSGDRALVAASAEFFASEHSNAAYLFERDAATGEWKQVARFTGEVGQEEGSFAASVALDGDRALVTTWGDPSSGRFSGAAYVYDRNPATGAWEQTARLTGGGSTRAGVFGGAAALDGDRVVVTASTYFREKPGSIYIFERDPVSGTWFEAARFGDIDDFYISVDIDGDRVLVGESKDGKQASGAATLFARGADGTWQLAAKLRPATPYDHGAFGSAVALDGDHALVSGYDEQLRMDFNIDRVVFVFSYSPEDDVWHQQHVVDIGQVAFASSLDLKEKRALIGQASEQQPGAAYVVHLR